MDFLQGIARLPWSFIRNTDRRYALKVWGEEAKFLDWRVTPGDYEDPDNFVRLKAVGFADLQLLSEFMKVLEGAVVAHGDAVEPVVETLQTAPIPDGVQLDLDSLVMAARAWMADVHDFCTLSERRLAQLQSTIVTYDRAVRQFRREHPWLLGDLTSSDVFEYVHPTVGAVVFTGLRTSPDGSEQVLFVANMEGAPRSVVPIDLVGVDGEGWELAVASPRLDPGAPDHRVTFSDATAAIWVRNR